MSSKDKTSRAEKSSLNALKYIFFMLKNPVFAGKKKEIYGFYHFQIRFLFSKRIPF